MFPAWMTRWMEMTLAKLRNREVDLELRTNSILDMFFLMPQWDTDEGIHEAADNSACMCFICRECLTYGRYLVKCLKCISGSKLPI